jgi:hypothetical protein
MQKCPRCGLTHADAVILCDCGFELASGKLLLKRRMLKGITAGVAMILVGMIAILATTIASGNGTTEQSSPTTLLLLLSAAVVVMIGVARLVRAGIGYFEFGRTYGERRAFLAPRHVRAALAGFLLLVIISLAFPPRKYRVDQLDFAASTSRTAGEVIFLTPFWTSDPSQGVRLSGNSSLGSLSFRSIPVIVTESDGEDAAGFAFRFWTLWEAIPMALVALAIGRSTR